LAADLPLAGDELIGTAWVPDGVELRLLRNEDDFAIVLERNELMSSDLHASEQALATMTCERLESVEAPHLLIGGYGMGFTLRAALAVLGPDASVTVAEIVPEIIDWARGPMRELTAGCLDDPRVLLMMDDVAMLIEAAEGGYDGILLDVDNGPEGLTRQLNDGLYSNKGLKSAMRALKPRGVLAIWSADAEPAFAAQLLRAGFEVSEVPVCARPDGTGDNHLIWFARKP
jgi:spermidine synthase